MTGPFASSLACRAVAVACLAYVGGAGAVGRANGPVAAVVSVACQAAAAA